jgi:hypothetical protein
MRRVVGNIDAIDQYPAAIDVIEPRQQAVKDLAGMTSIAQTTVALERIQAVLSADDLIRERADAVDPGRVLGGIVFDRVTFRYTKEARRPLADDADVLSWLDAEGNVVQAQNRGLAAPS